MTITTTAFDPASSSAEAEKFEVRLSLTATDAVHLWTAAASQLLAAPGMEMEDVIETLGPPEDISVKECLLALVSAVQTPGCSLDQIEVVRSVPARAARGKSESRQAASAYLSARRQASGRRLPTIPTGW